MATAASTAELAVLLIDASKGLLTQTRRHSHIVSLFGIREVVAVVNKMDAVGWSESEFERISEAYLAFAAGLGFANVLCVPACALSGDNITRASEAMPWYGGPTLIEHLESVDVAASGSEEPFRMPVQWVNRPNSQFRGYCGSVVSGRVHPGDRLAVAPSGKTAAVARIVTTDGDLDEAGAGQAVTLTLTEEIDVSRGDVLAAHDARPAIADQFSAHLLWMSEQPMLPGRSYLLLIGTALVPAQVTELKHRLNVNTFEHVAAKHLDLNEIALCNVSLDRPVAFDPYAENRDMGAFILIDRISNATVACGCTAPFREHSLAGTQGRQGGARGIKAAETLRAVAYRPLRGRKIHHRRPGGAVAVQSRPPYHRAGR
jgi:bifunctional enzyme CysN/CysC